MNKVLYQVEFKNNLGTRRSPVYADLDNVINSLECEGFERVDGSIYTYRITEVIDSYVTEKVNTFAVIHVVPYFEGRTLFKDHVYLKNKGEK